MKESIGHSLKRTSPFGTDFIGTCRNCGKEGLTCDDLNEDCSNPQGKTADELLLDVLDEEFVCGTAKVDNRYENHHER